jgi:hypothetical protein
MKAVEAEFKSHVPEIQEIIISEIESFGNLALQWVSTKLNPKPSNEDIK